MKENEVVLTKDIHALIALLVLNGLILPINTFCFGYLLAERSNLKEYKLLISTIKEEKHEKDN